MRYGYARVSTTDQNPALQLDALKKAGCEKLYIDHGVSGVAIARPQLDKCLKRLQFGDTLVVYKLDRLGRSLGHLIQTIDELRGRGVGFQSLTENLETNSPHGRLLLGMLGALAEFERSLIAERTAAGRAAAKKRGVRFGRPPKIDVVRERHARDLRAKGMPVPEVASILGVSRWTVYRLLREAAQ